MFALLFMYCGLNTFLNYSIIADTSYCVLVSLPYLAAPTHWSLLSHGAFWMSQELQLAVFIDSFVVDILGSVLVVLLSLTGLKF